MRRDSFVEASLAATCAVASARARSSRASARAASAALARLVGLGESCSPRSRAHPRLRARRLPQSPIASSSARALGGRSPRARFEHGHFGPHLRHAPGEFGDLPLAPLRAAAASAACPRRWWRFALRARRFRGADRRARRALRDSPCARRWRFRARHRRESCKRHAVADSARRFRCACRAAAFAHRARRSRRRISASSVASRPARSAAARAAWAASSCAAVSALSASRNGFALRRARSRAPRSPSCLATA